LRLLRIIVCLALAACVFLNAAEFCKLPENDWSQYAMGSLQQNPRLLTPKNGEPVRLDGKPQRFTPWREGIALATALAGAAE